MDVRTLTNSFLIIPKAMVLDSRISIQARFVYCYMASQSVDYDNSSSNMALDLGMKTSDLSKLLKELIKFGWISQSAEKSPNGKVVKEKYVIHDSNSARLENYVTSNDDNGTGMMVSYNIESNIGLKGHDAELKVMFDDFVKAYKETFNTRCRTSNTEFKDFIKQHPDWRDVIPILKPSIEIEDNLRREARGRNEFYPAPRDLRSYLGKDRAWEMYKDDVDSYSSDGYHPKLDGMNMSWDARYGCYIVPNFFGKVYDGYSDEERPDDAVIFSNGVYYAWNSQSKKWKKKK